MFEKNDWRLTNQAKFLSGEKLRHANYVNHSEKWDHDHCEFCRAKFSQMTEDLHEGYCTMNNYHWICDNCFNDFKDIFKWEVVND